MKLDKLLRDLRVARRHLERVESGLTDQNVASADEAKAAGVARDIQARRRLRQECLPGELLGEPVWDLMLALYVAHSEGRDTYGYDLFRACGLRPTTGSRILDKLETAGLIGRVPCPAGRRQVPVRLTADGLARMTRLLARWR